MVLQKPVNPFRNESVQHNVACLSKGGIKRNLKGGALTFEKRKEEMEGVDSVFN